MQRGRSPSRVDEYNPFAALLPRYVAALDRLAALGLRIAPDSRLASYRGRLAKAVVDPRPALPEDLTRQLAFDLREIDEIIEIVEYLPRPVDEACKQLLRSLHRGGDDPDSEVATDARESQYELYLGAVLRRAGVPARHGSPDLTAEFAGHTHHIEAKRPSKSQRLDDRIRSAVHQLRRLPGDGIIALSVDQLVRPAGAILPVPTFDELGPAVASLVEGFVRSNAGVWRNRLTGERVAAVIVTARVPSFIMATSHTALGTNIDVEPIRESPAARFAERVVSAYQEAQAERVNVR